MTRKRKKASTQDDGCVSVILPVDVTHDGFSAKHVSITLDTRARRIAAESWLAGMRRDRVQVKGERILSCASLLYWALDQVSAQLRRKDDCVEVRIKVPVDPTNQRPYPARVVDSRLMQADRHAAMRALVGGAQRSGVRVGERYVERAPDVLRHLLDQIANAMAETMASQRQ